MHITRDQLLSIARDNAAKQAARDRSLVCIYLVGSLLREDPFLGGVTDIDMVCVHDKEFKPSRELYRVNADIHLDITRLPQSVFDQPRSLRDDPWLGCPLDEGPLVLRDLSHWFDFTRANASAQFWRADHALARVNHFAVRARQTWQQLADDAIPQGIKRVQTYLDSLSYLANAVCCFTGSPLTTRRLLLELPDRAMKMDIPNFTGAFISMFTSTVFNDDAWAEWFSQWQGALDAVKAKKDAPLEVSPTRRNYHEKAAADLTVDRPAAALWIMLHSWTNAAAILPKSEPPYKHWQSFIRALALDSRSLTARIETLDTQLDSLETAIENWRETNP